MTHTTKKATADQVSDLEADLPGTSTHHITFPDQDLREDRQRSGGRATAARRRSRSVSRRP